jgi:ring-1,2-phenylacetyl-CoA epoxidase subunit PaaC
VTDKNVLAAYATRLGDNALIIGQRMIELVAAGPELEEELANANFALDYIGQARMFFSYAGECEGAGRSEDDFAFLRPEHEYQNLLLVEQPNGHFGDAIVRQVLFDSWYLALLEVLTRGTAVSGLSVLVMARMKATRAYNSRSTTCGNLQARCSFQTTLMMK